MTNFNSLKLCSNTTNGFRSGDHTTSKWSRGWSGPSEAPAGQKALGICARRWIRNSFPNCGKPAPISMPNMRAKVVPLPAALQFRRMNDSGATNTAEVVSGRQQPQVKLPLQKVCILWLLFFLICLGLWYPTLKRYDPARAEGLTDAIVYRQMVLGSLGPRPHAEVFAGRILVPGTAQIFYRTIGARIRSVDPITLSLLLAASIFCAMTGVLLVMLSRHLTGNAGVALCGIGGALAKETFVPFAAIFAMTWWIVEERHAARRFVTLGRIAFMILLSVATLIAVRSVLFGHIVWPWQIAAALNAGTGFLSSLVRCLSDRSFWYVFIWLLPLGILGVRSVPRAWRWPAATTCLCALLLGAYNDMGGTVARPIFNIAGAMLSFSVAVLLTRMLAAKQVAT